MDLLKELDGAGCYFEEQLPVEVTQLLDAAAENYGRDSAELLLLRAFLLQPESLTVLVALYRYYFYQHRLQESLDVAERAMTVSAARLGLEKSWQLLEPSDVAKLGSEMTMLRFYLFALKGAGYLNMRLERLEEGMTMLSKVRELDPADRLGASVLLEVARQSHGLRLVKG